MPELLAAVIAYNEERMLPGCLESVRGVVDRIIVVDGAYHHFPRQSPGYGSTDSTRHIAACYGVEFIPCPAGGWPTQMEKRSAYLVGSNGDWYLHIDADERLRGQLPALESLDPAVSYRMSVVWADGSMQPWAVRLFCHRGQMEYRGAHCALFSEGRLITRRQNARPLTEAWFVHLKSLRDPQRQREKLAYYRWQKDNEREFRTEWRI